MIVIAGCALLFAVGLVVIWRWSAMDLQPPKLARAQASPAQASNVVPRPIWYAWLVLVAGLIAGVLGAGAGGRLIMRMLALTSPPSADGRITEAQEVVGDIELGGTIALFIFGGVPAGLAAAALYVLLYRWLPSGRARGVAFGAFILVAFGWWVEPLRTSNPDFDIVGPAWLTVVAFGALALVEGMLVAAVVGRLSRAVPLQVKTPPTKAWKSHRALVVGRVALVAATLASLPASSSRSPTSSAAVRKRPRSWQRFALV
jgi:hypothetical protein